MSGKHETDLGRTASTISSPLPPIDGDGDLVLLAREVGKLADIVRAEIRWVRRISIAVLLVVLGVAVGNYMTISEANASLERKVTEDVGDLQEVLTSVRQNQAKIDIVIQRTAGVAAQTSKATEALAEAQAAEVETNPKKRAERKHEAAMKAIDASRAAQRLIRIETDPLP